MSSVARLTTQTKKKPKTFIANIVGRGERDNNQGVRDTNNRPMKGQGDSTD